MKFILSELRNNRFIQKEDLFDPQSFLGDAPDMLEYKAPLKATVRAELINTEVLVSGHVSTVVQCSCARCLKDFDKSVEGEFKQSFDASEPSIDVGYYIKEAMILEFPIKAVCQEKCLGLCPTCGKNKNETVCGCAEPAKHPGLDVLKQFRFPNR